MQLLPQGGSGTVQDSSDAVRRVCSCQLMVYHFQRLHARKSTVKFVNRRLHWQFFCIEIRLKGLYSLSEVFVLKLLSVIRRMLHMCPPAWYIFIRSVQLTGFLLLCAFVLLLGWNGSMINGYGSYMTAVTLYETGQAVLLIGGLFSVLIEDAQT